MTTTIIAYREVGHPFAPVRNVAHVETLGKFITAVRIAFEESADAVVVARDGVAVGIWIRAYEGSQNFPGADPVGHCFGHNYDRYDDTCYGFWNYVAGCAGSLYVPAGVGFISVTPGPDPEELVQYFNDGAECLTAAQRNPSLIGRR